MRLLLLLCATGMALLAVFFLRERRLPLTGYLGWGLLALLLPFLGPFLVILAHPGKPIHRRRRLFSKPNPAKLALRRAKMQLLKLFQA